MSVYIQFETIFFYCLVWLLQAGFIHLPIIWYYLFFTYKDRKAFNISEKNDYYIAQIQKHRYHCISIMRFSKGEMQ